jgi:hypothetical protein
MNKNGAIFNEAQSGFDQNSKLTNPNKIQMLPGEDAPLNRVKG